MDLEDRFKCFFVGFGRFRWIRVKMATYLDGSGKIWMTLSAFDWIWTDLVGFGRFRWIRVEMATYLDGSGKICMTLSGFDWIWADLFGYGRGYVWISKLDSVGYAGFSWIIKGFGWI